MDTNYDICYHIIKMQAITTLDYKLFNYNIFDELSDHTTDDEGSPAARLVIANHHRKITNLIR